MSPPLSWVVGAGGLLGSSVVRVLTSRGAELWSPTDAITWSEPEDASVQIRRAAAAFLAAAAGRPWQVAWCAGAGVTATGLADLEQEVVHLGLLLDALASSPSNGEQPRGSFFLASSAGGLYAGARGAPYDEETMVAPLSAYGRIKGQMEALVHDWAVRTGNRAVVGRIANLYGPGQGLSKPQGLISQIIRSHLVRSPISIYVPLDTMRDYLYAADCGEMVVDALGLLRSTGLDDGAVVTKVLASHQQVTVGGVLAEVRRLFKRSPQIILGASSQAAVQARDLRLTSRVWPELDRRPLTPLAAGIHATTEHIRVLQRAGRL